MFLNNETLKHWFAVMLQADKPYYSSFVHKNASLEKTALVHEKYHAPNQRCTRFQDATSAHPEYRYVHVKSNGKICSLAAGIKFDDNTTEPPTRTLLARYGDDIAGNSFARVVAEAMEDVVIGLMPDEDATKLEIKKCSAQIGNLASTDLNKPICSMADLGWDEAVYGKGPVGVALGKFLVVPPTYDVLVGHDIREPVPDDTETKKIWPAQRAWMNSMRHLFTYNKGRSLHVIDPNGKIACAK